MFKKSGKFFSAVLCIFFLASLALSGCGQSGNTQGTTEEGGQTVAASTSQDTAKPSGEKPTIRFTHYFTGSNPVAKYFEPELAKYVEDSKDKFTLKVETAVGDDLRTKIKTEIASDNVPDVFNWWPKGSITDMVNANVLLEIKEYIKNSKEITMDSFDGESWNGFSLDDGKNIYGLPFYSTTTNLIANKALFDKFGLQYPKTYGDLLAVAKVFNANGITPLACGSKNGNPSSFTFSSIYYQFGTLEYAKGFATGASKFNSPEMLKTAQYIQDMAKNGVFPKDTMASGDWGPAMALYNEQKAAMITVHAWNRGQVSPDVAKVSEPINFWKYDDAVNDPSTFHVGGVGGGYVISRKAYEDPNKQQALTEFLDYLMKDETLVAMVKGGYIPPKKMKIDINQYLDPLSAACNTFAQNTESKYYTYGLLPDASAQLQYTTAFLDPLWALGITPEQGVEKMQQEIDKSLGK